MSLRLRLPPVREGQTFAGESLLVRYVNFVKLPHTLFALPFALLGVLAASLTRAGDAARLVLLVVIAFSAARWAAMGFNRIADRDFDARNPRTAEPGAAPGRAHARPGVGLGAGGRRASSCSPPGRSTALPAAEPGRARVGPDLQPDQAIHLVAASLAGPQPGDRAGRRLSRGDRTVERRRRGCCSRSPLAVATWVAGFDIFYALPDEAFDRGEGLRSAVVRLGEPRAILLAKLLHGITIPALALFGWGAGFGALVLRRPGRRRRRSSPTSTSLVQSGRPLAARRGVLHHERGHERHGVRLRPGRPPGAMSPVSAARSRRPRDHRRLRRAVRRAAARGAGAATGCRSGSSSRATGCACSRPKCGIGSLETLRRGHRRRLVLGRCRSPTAIAGRFPPRARSGPAGMVICPCSMGTVAAVAAGTSRSLVERAADVTLKERRKLILVPRETPLSLVHLRNLVTVDRGRRGGHPGGAGLLSPPVERRRAGGLHRAAGARSARARDRDRAAAGPATSPGDEARRVGGGDGRGRLAGCGDGDDGQSAGGRGRAAGGRLHRRHGGEARSTRVCFPADWNGDLIVYAHGYVEPQAPARRARRRARRSTGAKTDQCPGLRLRHHELPCQRPGGRRSGGRRARPGRTGARTVRPDPARDVRRRSLGGRPRRGARRSSGTPSASPARSRRAVRSAISRARSTTSAMSAWCSTTSSPASFPAARVDPPAESAWRAGPPPTRRPSPRRFKPTPSAVRSSRPSPASPPKRIDDATLAETVVGCSGTTSSQLPTRERGSAASRTTTSIASTRARSTTRRSTPASSASAADPPARAALQRFETTGDSRGAAGRCSTPPAIRSSPSSISRSTTRRSIAAGADGRVAAAGRRAIRPLRLHRRPRCLRRLPASCRSSRDATRRDLRHPRTAPARGLRGVSRGGPHPPRRGRGAAGHPRPSSARSRRSRPSTATPTAGTSARGCRRWRPWSSTASKSSSPTATSSGSRPRRRCRRPFHAPRSSSSGTPTGRCSRWWTWW